MMSIATSLSPSRRRIPRTPPAAREVRRTWETGNRMDIPCSLTITRSSASLASRIDTSSSPGSMSIALRPLERMLARRLSDIRFISPMRVANRTSRSSCSEVTASRVLTDSPSGSLKPRNWTRGTPRVLRELSANNSYTFIRYTRPLLVKNSR